MIPPSTIRDLCALSALVYEPWALIEAEIGADLSGEYDVGDTQAMLVRRAKYSAIVFRGTELSSGRWRDLWSNFGRSSSWEGEGRVHSGYAAALRRVFPAALAMADRCASRVPLYVTGHSMGGALATLYACRVGGADKRRLAGLVTFGAPRPARSSAYASLRCEVTRVVNAGDFAPAWWGALRFSHPPGIPLIVDSGGPVDGLERHRVENYRLALRSL